MLHAKLRIQVPSLMIDEVRDISTMKDMDDIRQQAVHIVDSYKVVYEGNNIFAVLDIVYETINFKTGDRTIYNEAGGREVDDHKTEWMIL